MILAVSVTLPILAVTLYCPSGTRNACVFTLFARPASCPFTFSIKKFALTGRRPTFVEAESLRLPKTPVGVEGVGGVGVGGGFGVGVGVGVSVGVAKVIIKMGYAIISTNNSITLNM